jgi:hypothetical protein
MGDHVVMPRAWRWVCAVGIVGGAAGCGAVLGLNDYGDAVEGGAEANVQAPGPEAGDDGSGYSTTDATMDALQDAPASALPDVRDAGMEALSSDGGAEGDAPTDADAGADAMGAETGPATWTRVAFAPGSRGSCPAGFASTPTDVVLDTATATVGSGACTCDCAVTSPPSCVTGAITGSYGLFSTTCTTTSPSLGNAPGGGCDTAGVPTTPLSRINVLWNAVAPTGGTCSTTLGVHPEQVTFASHGTTCTRDVDAGDAGVPSPFLDCIAIQGNVPCPSGPLSVAHSVGTGAAVSCSGGCTCTTSATCGSAQVTYYTSGSCGTGSGSTFVMPADGTCHQLNGSGNTFNSYVYSATVQNPACTTSSNPTATVTGLAAEMTICCGQ